MQDFRLVCPLFFIKHQTFGLFALYPCQIKREISTPEYKDNRLKNDFFIFPKCLDFTRFIWYCVVYNKMNVIKELWHGNIASQDDCRNNSPETKQPIGIHNKASEKYSMPKFLIHHRNP